MRYVAFCFATLLTLMNGPVAFAQVKPPSKPLEPAPKAVTMAQLDNISTLSDQLIEIGSVVVRHSDTAQVFTFGEAKGREVHVLIPAPAVDAPHVGDAVALTGYVRKYDPKKFEAEYKWFREADYPDVHTGDWVVVAVSVRTQEGSQLVPGNTISTTPSK